MATSFISRDLTLFFASYLMQLSLRAEKKKAASKKYRQENPEKAKVSKLAAIAKKPEHYLAKAAAWGNHGVVWELDHILPCAKFHLQHSEEQEVCFHWTNFQPLFVEDNRAKGDKVL